MPPVKLTTPGINGSTVPLPLRPGPEAGAAGRDATPRPRNRQSRLASAWYQLPAPDAAHPLVVVTAAGTITGNSVFNGRTEGQTVELEYGAARARRCALVPAGRVVPYDLGPIPSWRNLRFDRPQIPADATAVRVIAEDLSLTPGDWIAVTPPRVPELRIRAGVHRLRRSRCCWTGRWAWPSRASSRCCTPTASPRSRSSASRPDYNAKKLDTDSLGGRPQRRPARASPTCCCGARDGHVPVATTGAATGARCASSTPSSTPSPRDRARLPRPAAGCTAGTDPHQAVVVPAPQPCAPAHARGVRSALERWLQACVTETSRAPTQKERASETQTDHPPTAGLVPAASH